MADGTPISTESISQTPSAAAIQGQKTTETKPKTRQDVYGRDDNLAFNAGHTEAIQKSLPDLVTIGELHEVAGLSTESTQILLSLPVDSLARYLAEKQTDQPHALPEVITLMCEELKQVQDPNKLLSGVLSEQENLKDLQESGADPDEIAEAQQYLKEAQEAFQMCLTRIPNQAVAINQFLEHPDTNTAVTTYLEAHGDTPREVNGSLTNQTYREYLIGQFGIMRGNITLHTEQFLKVLPQVSVQA